MVSVLFADLVGFTPFSEGRDPEEVRAMLTVYFDRSREIVERFAGSVDKYIGDAVMAVWGATEAHEEDAELAVRAALELVDMVAALGAELGVDELALRAGVLTGETSVGPGGNEKGLVVGDLVNTASRLQSIAEPGTVLVGEPTARLIEDAIAVTPLGDQAVKGKEVPVAAFRAGPVLGERGGRNRSGGIEPPFVGRDDELRLLKDQLHAAGRDGRARLVSVIGEAGIGKSRLLWETLKYVDGIHETILWHSGRSPAYGDGLTYWALGEMIRSRAGIAETDDQAKSRMKLRTTVAEYVPSEDDRQWLEPRLAGLLGLADMPSGDRNELFAAIRTFFHHIADQGTTVLAFEDTHWADPGLLDFIAELVERSPRHPILVITLARPDLLDTRPNWASGMRNAIALTLAPLSTEAMNELVRGAVPGIPDDAVATIVERAAGVPLYAVEFIRMLVASGDVSRDGQHFELVGSLEDLAVPDSLQAVIGARLDRLSADDRTLIQDAAVLGQSFTIDGMSAVTGQDQAALEGRLSDLVDQELLELDDDPRSPERGQFRFVQSVIREVAYGRLSRDDRYSRHVRVAEFFESLDEVEVAGVVASHYLSAHEATTSEETELLERGRAALIDAAERAVALAAFDQAQNLATRALGIAASPQEQAPILELAGFAAGWAGRPDDGIDLCARAAAAYAELGDDDGRIRALAKQGFILNSYYRSGEAADLLEPVLDSFDGIGTMSEARLGLETARAFMLGFRFEEAVAVSDRTLPIAEGALEPEAILDGLITRATALAGLERDIEADSALRGIISMADERGLQAQAIRALNNRLVILAYREPRRAFEGAHEVVERSRRLGAAGWEQRSFLDLAAWQALAGEFDEAADTIAEVDSEILDDMGLERLRYHQALVAMLRSPDGDGGGRAEAEELAAAWMASSDGQLKRSGAGFVALNAILVGDWKTAHAAASATPDDVLTAAYALLSAAWLRDHDAVTLAVDNCRTVLPVGRLRETMESIGRATLLALDGEIEAANTAFFSAVRLADEVLYGIDAVLTKALHGALVGLDHPDAAASGRETLAWIRRTGALALVAALQAGLPLDEATSETA